MKDAEALNSPESCSSELTVMQDENYEQRDKRSGHIRSKSLPAGVTPEHAAKTLPSAIKAILVNHAQSESSSYLVLLPHEVVQLNDVHFIVEPR
jgi:hypothetical protein